MIYVGLNTKGGVGKSTTTHQFVTAGLQIRYNKLYGKEKPVIIYEFDKHTNSLNRVSNDALIICKNVGASTKEMSTAFAEIEFDSIHNDIVIDIGGADNTERFLSMLEDNPIASKMIFIIPEEKQSSNDAVRTIWLLRETVGEDAKILLALNYYSGLKSVEEEYPFVYGSKEYGIKASDILSDEKVKIATLPESNTLLALAYLEKKSIWSFGEEYRKFGKLSVEERIKEWKEKGDDEKSDAFREKFIKNTLSLNVSKLSFDALEKSSLFFRILEEWHDAQ